MATGSPSLSKKQRLNKEGEVCTVILSSSEEDGMEDEALFVSTCIILSSSDEEPEDSSVRVSLHRGDNKQLVVNF